MGEVIRSMDWSKTPLGPKELWPQSLRTTVGLVVNSNFPIAIAWGPGHTQIYNDGYCPLCGVKHPKSMGQDFSECWASAFHAIGDAFRSALAGKTAFLEDQRMFLDRLGYLEKTFFTFSFSPIRDETGKVAGLFQPVTETTSKMVGQRRTRALRDVVQRGAKATSVDEALALVAQTLADSDLDLPFVLLYKVDAGGKSATLVAQAGLAAGGVASPLSVDLTRQTSDETPDELEGWPLARIAGGDKVIELDDVPGRFPGMVCSPYPEAIKSAFGLPIYLSGHGPAVCIMVAGASARLPINDAYRAFYDALADTVTTVIANATSYETERKRADALAEFDRLKTTFFANVSHEFRTPLTLILGPLTDELAEHEAALPPGRRARIEIAHRNSLRLLKLVNTLLDFARIQSGRAQAVYEPTDLPGFTSDLVGNFRSACERAGLVLNVERPAQDEPVYLDREMWKKIVLNLLSNAFKFTMTGEITVGIKAAGQAVELWVSDTEVGIPAEELSRVFERFYRVQGTQGRTHEGSGIGLALVRELVALHGGSIRAESIPGEGSTFTVTVPRGTTHLPAERIGALRTMASTAMGAGPYVAEALAWLGAAYAEPAVTIDETLPLEHAATMRAEVGAAAPRPRIVWVDDNADMRDYVRRLLTERYEVEAVADEREAMDALRRQAPDLVLCDVMMPRLDGLGLLHELRRDLEKAAALQTANLAQRESRREALNLMEEALNARRQAEAAKAIAETASKAKDHFLAVLSHELRTPLTPVVATVAMLQEDARFDAETRESLEMIRRNVEMEARLIDDLLDVTRVEQGKIELDRQPVELGGILRRAAAVCMPDIEGRKLEFGIDMPDGPYRVDGDVARLQPVIWNLLKNAITFTPEGRRVGIRCRREVEGYVLVEVHDAARGSPRKCCLVCSMHSSRAAGR